MVWLMMQNQKEEEEKLDIEKSVNSSTIPDRSSGMVRTRELVRHCLYDKWEIRHLT